VPSSLNSTNATSCWLACTLTSEQTTFIPILNKIEENWKIIKEYGIMELLELAAIICRQWMGNSTTKNFGLMLAHTHQLLFQHMLYIWTTAQEISCYRRWARVSYFEKSSTRFFTIFVTCETIDIPLQNIFIVKRHAQETTSGFNPMYSKSNR